MRVIKLKYISVSTLVIVIMGLFSCNSDKDLSTVESLDLNKYKGLWYEIARLPNRFEKNLECVTARYTLDAKGKVIVENSGYNTKSLDMESITGKAWVPDSTTPGVLKVRFFWPFAGDYYVIDVDEDYQTALVGSPDRKYLWILSRSTNIEKVSIL